MQHINATENKTDDPAALSITEATRLIDHQELTPTQLMESIWHRIDKMDSQIHAYLRTDRTGAFAQAEKATERARKGKRLSPLDGIPFAVKDNIYTAGMATTAGSRVPQNYDENVNATLVTLLQEAGAILIGKLNTWEYGTGTGAVYDDLPHPPARNPWNTDHYTGGSSSGCGASVAAGMAMFAIGTDTGGSVRLPAAGCGVVGLKPTFGHISRHGIIPNCWSFDTPGPFTVTSEDAYLIYQTIAQADKQDPSCLPPAPLALKKPLSDNLKGLKVGLVTNLDPGEQPPEPEIIDALNQAAAMLQNLGAQVTEIEMPIAPADYRKITVPINRSESFSIHEQDYLHHRDLMGKALRDKLEVGMYMRATDYLAALRQRRELVAQTDHIFDDVDVLLLPITYLVAPRMDDPEAVKAFTTRSAGSVFSLTGHPAMTIPMGFTGQGLPIPIQLAAGFNQEHRLLSCAKQLEQLRDIELPRVNLNQFLQTHLEAL